MPYAIIKIDTGEVVRRFSSMPRSFDVVVDGHSRRIVAPVAVGDEGLGFRFVDWVQVNFDSPGDYYTRGSDADIWDGANTLTTTREWTAWTPQEIDDSIAAQKEMTAAAAFDNVDAADRALALVILDELNLHAARITAILNAIDNGSNLTNIKAAVAQIADAPTRTPAQLRAAFLTKLGS